MLMNTIFHFLLLKAALQSVQQIFYLKMLSLFVIFNYLWYRISDYIATQIEITLHIDRLASFSEVV